jgi:hypothetical protein
MKVCKALLGFVCTTVVVGAIIAIVVSVVNGNAPCNKRNQIYCQIDPTCGPTANECKTYMTEDTCVSNIDTNLAYDYFGTVQDFKSDSYQNGMIVCCTQKACTWDNINMVCTPSNVVQYQGKAPYYSYKICP